MSASPPSMGDAHRKALAVRPEELGIGKLFERVRDAVVVAHAHTGRVVLWNPAATEVFGYTPSEALGLRRGRVRLEVGDEGRGFDPSASSRTGGRGERVGLAGMRERVDLLGGELSITSAPGSGTTVVAEVPLEEDPEAKISYPPGR